MASGLQIRNNFGASGGYSNGVSSGNIPDWSDTGLSGAHTTTVYWQDKITSPFIESTVYMTVTDTWSGTRNSDNSITLHVHSSYSMNRVKNAGPGGYCYGAGVRDGRVIVDNVTRFTYAACISGSGVFSSGSVDWTITLGHGQERNVGSYYVINQTRGYPEGGIYTDYISGGVAFRNTLPAPPYNPNISLSCGHVSDTTNGRAELNIYDWGCPGGGNPANNCNLSSTVQWARDASFNNIIATGTGIKGLQPNTHYWVRAIVSNGYYTSTRNCEFTTLASSNPYGYLYKTDQVSYINVQINNGNDRCDITTKLYIKSTDESNYHLITTTTAESGFRQVLRNFIQRGKTYQAYTTTTNCAGTYTSPIYTFAPPPADNITGEITKSDSTLEEMGQLADIDYCYKITSYTLDPVSEENPMSSRIEYRPVGQTDWITTDTVTSTKNPDTICGTITGVLCGTEYQLRSYQEVGNTNSYSKVVTITTPLCADVNNCVCDNLYYITELICQELANIKQGEKTVYANCSTKELCDPYSKTPTMESILSRIVRFSQMAACLICSMDAMTAFKAGGADQVYTATEPGEFGEWITLDKEMIEDSDNLISSGGVYNAINDFLNSILRPIGKYNYFAEDLEDLEEQSSSASSGYTGVIGDTYYTYDGTDWSETGEVVDLQDWGLILITDGTFANHEFYWWNDKWNIIDGSGDLEDRIQVLEEGNPVVSIDNTNYNVGIGQTTESDAEIIANNPSDGENPVTVFIEDNGDGYFRLDRDALDNPMEVLV